MTVQKITKQLLEHPPVPEQGQTVIWDSSPGMGGFGIRVLPSGRVTFTTRYWTGSQERWMALGPYPRLNLTQAKAKAREVLLAAGNGRDPAAEKRQANTKKRIDAERTLTTLSDIWLEYLPTHATRRGRKISPHTVHQYKHCMRKHIIPALGRRPVSEIGKGDVRSLHQRVSKKNGPYMANRVVAVLSIFYSWLARNEYIDDSFNPAQRAPHNPEVRRGEDASVRLTKDQEARLLRAIYDEIGGDPIGATALLALLDTGRRLQEVLGMEWRRLDLDTGTADLGRTKGKAAGDVCYLTQRVRDAVRTLPRIVGNPYVFTGRGSSGRREGLKSVWARVKTAAKLERLSPDLEGFHIHDLRHHRISEMLAAGVAPQLVAQQVGHTSLNQLKVYSHLKVLDVAKVMSKLDLVQPAEKSEVTPIKQAG